MLNVKTNQTMRKLLMIAAFAAGTIIIAPSSVHAQDETNPQTPKAEKKEDKMDKKEDKMVKKAYHGSARKTAKKKEKAEKKADKMDMKENQDK
jgi:hypothetical protein